MSTVSSNNSSNIIIKKKKVKQIEEIKTETKKTEIDNIKVDEPIATKEIIKDINVETTSVVDTETTLAVDTRTTLVVDAETTSVVDTETAVVDTDLEKEDELVDCEDEKIFEKEDNQKKTCLKDMNVNLFNKLLLNYKKREYSEDKKAPLTHNAQIALYILNTTLCDVIVKNAIINVTKDVVGMVTLNYGTLYNSLANDEDLRRPYLYCRSLFDNLIYYDSEYTVNYTNIMKRIGKIDERIKLSQEDGAYNFLIFLLLRTTKEVIRNSDLIRIAGKMGTINDKHIVAAVHIFFGDTHLEKILENKIIDGCAVFKRETQMTKSKKKEEKIEKIENEVTVLNQDKINDSCEQEILHDDSDHEDNNNNNEN